MRKIYPVVADVSREGYRRVSDTELAEVVDAVLAKRMLRPEIGRASCRERV